MLNDITKGTTNDVALYLTGPEQAVSGWSGKYANKMTARLNVNKSISVVWLGDILWMSSLENSGLFLEIFIERIYIKSNKKCLL